MQMFHLLLFISGFWYYNIQFVIKLLYDLKNCILGYFSYFSLLNIKKYCVQCKIGVKDMSIFLKYCIHYFVLNVVHEEMTITPAIFSTLFYCRKCYTTENLLCLLFFLLQPRNIRRVLRVFHFFSVKNN